MANEVRIRASVKDDASKPLGSLHDAWKRFQTDGSKGLAIGVGAVAAAKSLDLLGSAVGAVTAGIGDSIQAASDLSETMSKSRVVFGGSAKDIEAFGDTAAGAMGLSKQAAIEAAATFGNLFTGLGQARPKAAEMSKALVTLSGDLASFNNLDPTLVLEKLRSGLSGEAEPLRSLGVYLSEAKVKAKAMELGLGSAHGELTEGEKVLARYQIILDETTTAQGDFARTSDGLANSTRIANAELENTQALLGEKFLPVQLEVTRAQVQLLTGLDAVAASMDGKLTPAVLALWESKGKLAFIAPVVRAEIATLGVDTLKTAQAMGILTEAEVDAELRARGLNEAGTDLGGQITSLAERFPEAGDAAKGAGDEIAKVGSKAKTAAARVHTSMAKIVSDVKGARSALESAASDAASAIYDPLIAKYELAATERELSEQEQIRSSKNSTKEQVADAQKRIYELRKQRVQQLAELAGYGDESAKKTLEHQLDVLTSTKNLTTEQKEEIRLLRAALALLKGSYDAARTAAQRLAEARITGALDRPGQAPKPRAHGGPVTKGEAYIVGENRPELFIPNTSGTILPYVPSTSSPSPVGMGGGSITFAPTVVVQGLATPAVKEQIVRELGPLFGSWLRQNGYAPR